MAKTLGAIATTGKHQKNLKQNSSQIAKTLMVPSPMVLGLTRYFIPSIRYIPKDEKEQEGGNLGLVAGILGTRLNR